MTITHSNIPGIKTIYRGPTANNGSRIAADAGMNRIIVPYNHDLNEEENHAVAAQALCDKFNWAGNLRSAWRSDERGMYFVFCDK